MTSNNIVLTEKAIKNHSKRLLRELKQFNTQIKLSDAQQILARTFGFNNFYELQKIVEANHKIKDTKSLLFKQFIEKIEHKTSFIWLDLDGNISYYPHNDKNNLLRETSYFTKFEVSELLNYILESKPDYQYKIIEQLLINPGDDNHLLIQSKEQINKLLNRNLIFQLYFGADKQFKAIKILISYHYLRDSCSRRYVDIKEFFDSNAIPKYRPRDSINQYQKDNLFLLLDGETIHLGQAYIDLYNICIEGSLSKFKKHVLEQNNLDLNNIIDTRTWEPKSAIEFALAYDHFEMVLYMIRNAKKLGIDLNISNDYILRKCVVECTDQHFAIIKELLNHKLFKYSRESDSYQDLVDALKLKNIKMFEYIDARV